MYKLTISAYLKSKARLLGIQVKYFIVGQEYDIYFVVKNIGDKPSPPGKFYYDIKWPGTPAATNKNFNFKSLEPGKCDKIKTEKYLALSTGLAGILAHARTYSPENEKIDIWKKDGKGLLGPKEAFETFYATTPESIYEYWALWLAAVGLFLTAVNWNLFLFLSLSAFGLIFFAFKINSSKMQKLQLVFSLIISGYLGQFSYWMSILRVIDDTIKAGYLRSYPYISEYNKIYGIKWRVNIAHNVPIQYHILMIAGITFVFWSVYTLYKVARNREELTEND